jgi:hypothetical protein
LVDESEVVDESKVVSGDGDGNDGAWQVSAQVQGGVDRVSSVVGLPESCKHCLELWVRSGMRVEGCQDRVIHQVRRTLSVSKRK